MILIDCGNSQLKAQFLQAGQLRGSFASSYRDDWNGRLTGWLRSLSASHCYFASVLDSKRQAQLDQSLQHYFCDRVTRYCSEASCMGITNGYSQPERLGVDRWLALIAARQLVNGDCIVIDAGSAITVDLLSADGRHLGGAILPGINSSIDRFKQIFSHIDFNDPAINHTEEPGSSTEQAIHINYTQNSLEYLSLLLERWENRTGASSRLLCGGDAGQVQRRLGKDDRIVPDLVFQGMYRLVTA
jgi:type III pantothenate kinase